MINMRIIFNPITMMLINHISNMDSSRFEKNNCTLKKINWLFKFVQVGKSR